MYELTCPFDAKENIAAARKRKLKRYQSLPRDVEAFAGGGGGLVGVWPQLGLHLPMSRVGGYHHTARAYPRTTCVTVALERVGPCVWLCTYARLPTGQGRV